ncbi:MULTISPECIES: HepT-like ribonuclease domain-containing protein [Proteiniphilum]|uniref:HepT-like ribonuclease domain-containing protein n=1 Tax=Proteiniphilum TaxID=294702 RepID=UPI000360F7AB|nr:MULTISPECIES: HepT-like ribonuclease domain-containing protein [Proteiniphilum]MDY9919373.1 DUF86 domain-containing protein [Proteiniphilum sp.]SFK40354.1 Uncharacterized conserved protein, contains HEPN domain [Porphyromonadaceae bacterium KH3CP3RA]
MSKRDILFLLDDMLQSAQKIKRYVKGHDYNSFLADDKTKDAVVRNFEIIGEAANRIVPDFRDKNPEIEWTRIRGFRNRIVHDYFGVDYEIVWNIIETYLDEMIVWLETVIKNNK